MNQAMCYSQVQLKSFFKLTFLVRGKKVRGRLYPWGVIEVENMEHNDFIKLRSMLM